MESNYTKMPPKGSRYTAALETWPTSLLKFAKRFQSLIQFLEIQLINITFGIESAISGVVDYKLLMIWHGMTPLRHFY